MAEKELSVRNRGQFAEAVLDEFLRHFLRAAAGHFHLIERLHRAQTRGMAGIVFTVSHGRSQALFVPRPASRAFGPKGPRTFC